MKRSKLIFGGLVLAILASSAPAYALASGCDDFWYSASGWQWIAELIVDRC